jgi:hypothetical protein
MPPIIPSVFKSCSSHLLNYHSKGNRIRAHRHWLDEVHIRCAQDASPGSA